MFITNKFFSLFELSKVVQKRHRLIIIKWKVMTNHRYISLVESKQLKESKVDYTYKLPIKN